MAYDLKGLLTVYSSHCNSDVGGIDLRVSITEDVGGIGRRTMNGPVSLRICR